MLNALGREIPDVIEGYGPVKCYHGAFAVKPEGRSAGSRCKKGPKKPQTAAWEDGCLRLGIL